MAGQYFVDQFAHALAGAELDPLAQADHGHPGPDVLSYCVEYATERLRRYRHYHDIHAGNGFPDARGRPDALGQDCVRQVLAVRMP